MIKIRLNEVLKERNVLQKDLAIASGLRETSVGDMLRGFCNLVNLDLLEKVMNCLGMTAYNEIFEKVEDEK